MMADKLTYSAAETAEVLGVSRPVVYTLIKRNDFPCFKVGSRTLISADGLREWVRQQAKTGGTE